MFVYEGMRLLGDLGQAPSSSSVLPSSVDMSDTQFRFQSALLHHSATKLIVL